jgi:hypothetical protein
MGEYFQPKIQNVGDNRFRGIMATTHVHPDGTRFAKEALEDNAKRVNEKAVHMNIEHNPTTPPVGRITHAWVEKLADGEWALMGEGEFFEHPEVTALLNFTPKPLEKVEPKKGRLLVAAGKANFVDDEYTKALQETLTDVGDAEVSATLIQRSAMPDPIVYIHLGDVANAFWWFGKGFFVAAGATAGRQVGKEVGKDLVAAYKAAKAKLFKMLERRNPIDRDPLLILTVDIEETGQKVRVEGSFRGKEKAQIDQFLDSASELIESARRVLAGAANWQEIEKLHFSYNEETGWKFSFGMTKDTVPFIAIPLELPPVDKPKPSKGKKK